MSAPTKTRTDVPWYERRFLGFDTESTGVDTKSCRMVSAALVIVNREGAIERSFYELVRQDAPIPEDATKIHGITTERCQLEGQPLGVVAQKIIDALAWAAPRRVPVVMFNATFDWSLLHAEAARCLPGIELPPVLILDPLVIDRHLDKFRKGSRKLADVARQYAIDPDTVAGELHDARKDAVLATMAMRRMAEHWFALQASKLEDLHTAQSRWYRDWRDQINEHWRVSLQDKRVEGEWPR